MQYNGLLDLYNKEKEKNKECEVTLKQTQKSWYEDSKDIEEYRIIHDTLTNKILDLENELKIEKETSHFIQSQLDIANAKLLEEKEERKKAEHNYDELTKTTGKLEIELEEEKEKNKELEKKYKIEKLKNVLDEQCLKEALEETEKDLKNKWKDKIREIIKKHEEARDIAGEQLTTTQIIADSNSLNYGRIQAHNVVIKDLQELLEE